MNEEYERIRKRWLMEHYKTKEQALVETFQGLSLAETVDKLQNLGIRTEVKDGLVVLHHPMLEPEYEHRYPETLILIRGRRP